MNTELDAQQLRRSSASEIYRDGLMDMAIGCLFFIVALASGRPAFYWTFLLAILVLGPGLKRMRARFTYPRIGYAELAEDNPRKTKRAILIWIIGVFVVTAVVLAFTGAAANNLAWRRAAPAIAGLLFSGGFISLARQSGFIRYWAMAAASIVLGGITVLVHSPEPYGNLRIWALVMALLSLVWGGLAFRRFIRDYPIVEQRQPDE